jgi:hypothetical protein
VCGNLGEEHNAHRGRVARRRSRPRKGGFQTLVEGKPIVGISVSSGAAEGSASRAGSSSLPPKHRLLDAHCRQSGHFVQSHMNPAKPSQTSPQMLISSIMPNLSHNSPLFRHTFLCNLRLPSASPGM